MVKEGIIMEQVELKLHGQQEKFTESFGACNYDCLLQRYWLGEGIALISLACYPDKDYFSSEEYYAIANENTKHVKLIGKYGSRMSKKLCQVLNQRFSESWKVKFI